MKKLYKAPRLRVIYGVYESPLLTGSEDITTDDNNPDNGGGTFGGYTPGINYGEDWTGGGNLDDGDLGD